MFTSLKRIIGLGWQNVARDRGAAAANVLIIMIPILLASALFFAKDMSAFLVKEMQSKADVSIYFNESVVEDDILRVKDKIAQIPGIGQVEYVSKDAALEDFRRRHQNDPALLESLGEVNGNPLFSLLHVSAASPAQFDQLAETMASGEYKDLVSKIDYGEERKKETVKNIFAFADGLQKFGLALFLMLGAVSLLVTFNTVRMAIVSRKREVGIQRLVGASRWFIRGQFLVEGLIFGVLAAAFAMLVSAAVCHYAAPALAQVMPGFDLQANFSAGFWRLLGIQMAAGAGLGVFSSVIAVGRHLKV